MTRRFHVQTLGCKLNQADSARVEAELRSRGMAAATQPEEADLLVLNTCTVTSRADADARRILRRLQRINPEARLVAMGCYAERDPGSLASLPGVHRVAGGSDPLPVIREAMSAFPGELTEETEPYHAAPAVRGRTRAYLKVQDGCNLTCSYCIIPTVRGRSRSLPPEMLVDSLERLVDAGFVEVVLTGVNTGDWGRDLPGSPGLVDLLERLVRVPGLGRLRLNSLEPRTISDELLEFLAATPVIARHLQIPLQSGSDRILAAMRRNYRRDMYIDLLERLAERMPDIGLGADVIVGFPGETDDDFRLTEELVRRSPLSYLHVFSYSPRPGTDAADLGSPVLSAVVKARVARLRRLATRKGDAFRRRFIDRVLQAITLQGPRADGRIRALTGNFFEVGLRPGTADGNRLVDVRVTAVDADGAHGVAVGPARAAWPLANSGDAPGRPWPGGTTA